VIHSSLPCLCGKRLSLDDRRVNRLYASRGDRNSGTPGVYEAWIVYEISKRSLTETPLVI